MAEPVVALFWGDDPYLLRQAAVGSLESRGVRALEVDGADWRGGETSDLATPSLFGERRGLLVTNCQGLAEDAAKELRGYVGNPSPDALCVLTMVSRAKSLPPLAKAVQAAGGHVRQLVLKRQELPRWVMDMATGRGIRISPQGAQALIGSVGESTALLDRAIEQLGSAFPGQAVGPDHVHAQFQGLGEQRVWDLCDQALAGRLPQALVTLRSLFEQRDDPLMVLGGIASRVRDLLRVRSLPDRMPAAEAARAAGLRFDWQVRRYREQATRFSPEDLVELHGRIVESDRALKGGAAGEVVLPALVAAMAGEGEAALDIDVRVTR